MLIEIKNLMPEDYAPTSISKIEEGLGAGIKRVLGQPDMNISFSFPKDPTISTAEIPVFIIIYLHECAMSEVDMAKLVKEVATSLKQAVDRRTAGVSVGLSLLHMIYTERNDARVVTFRTSVSPGKRAAL